MCKYCESYSYFDGYGAIKGEHPVTNIAKIQHKIIDVKDLLIDLKASLRIIQKLEPLSKNQLIERLYSYIS